jgi:tetratricopeptide (TPR) repeat protein
MTFVVVACATVPAVSSAQAPLTGAARWADTVRVTIERANLNRDDSALTQAGALADRALGAFPNDPLLLHYRAYALYREYTRGSGARGAEYKAAMERAIDLLNRSAAVRNLPETQALLATCYGMLAGDGMVAGMRYGPAANDARDAALKLGPRNPRVLFLVALNTWFTPKMWGGGEDKGYELMQRAAAEFATEAPARPLPAWGHAEAYAWLGQMELKRGKVDAARAAYTKALALEPGFPWVQFVLLPALDAKR